MNCSLRQVTLRPLLRWSQAMLLLAAAALLGYCAVVTANTWMYQRQAGSLFDHARSVPAAESDGLLGRMEIPRLGLSVMIAEGTRPATLQRAGGHIAGTALPGRPGNIGIAGHRDSLFRPLRNVRENDVITLTTLAGEYRYRVVSTKIVSPSDLTVLNSGQNEMLTLITCYPFYFVGPAPDRFIVQAKRVTGST